jgi:hypothetical protein
VITEADKGWLAGILDIQGHLTRKSNAQRADGSVQMVLYVQTKSLGIASRLCALTGVNVEFHEHRSLKEEWTRKGCADHCPEAHVHTAPANMPDMARWSLTGAAAAVVLWNLRSQLASDEENWDAALAACLAGTRLSGPGSGMTLKAIRRLHQLGWDLPAVMQGVTDTPALAAG